MRIAAYMRSCEARDELRARTLRNLAATDWGEPVHVEMDVSTLPNPRDRIILTAQLLLRGAVADGPDFILFLEDDLEFNDHLRHNLVNWAPLRSAGPHFFGSLFNPNLTMLGGDERQAYFVTDPPLTYGSQAFLMSLETAAYVVERWHESQAPGDVRMVQLAGRLSSIYYHTP